MKCVELVGPKKLEVKSRVAPTSKDGSVVFRVNTCGICGSDIHYWDNDFENRKQINNILSSSNKMISEYLLNQ